MKTALERLQPVREARERRALRQRLLVHQAVGQPPGGPRGGAG